MVSPLPSRAQAIPLVCEMATSLNSAPLPTWGSPKRTLSLRVTSVLRYMEGGKRTRSATESVPPDLFQTCSLRNKNFEQSLPASHSLFLSGVRKRKNSSRSQCDRNSSKLRPSSNEESRVAIGPRALFSIARLAHFPAQPSFHHP